jgi:nickel/cobalt transporter (NicO) family protein
MILALSSQAGLLSLVHEFMVKSPFFSFTAARRSWRGARAALLLAALLLLAAGVLLSLPALAQGAHHPFAVGGNEGALGTAKGLSGWLLAKQAGFYRMLSTAIRAAKESGMAAFGLASLSFAYGVFHAAGPGHGKMVIASYMLANERALRRGIAIAFGAAFLQGLSAISIVGISAVLFRATAKHMTMAANGAELASYAGIVILGAVLVYVKGAALLSCWREPKALAAASAGGPTRVFPSDSCAKHHAHGPEAAHCHAPDPGTLGAGFSLKSALLTVAAAGLRPCSGAILVLVFALSQGVGRRNVLWDGGHHLRACELCRSCQKCRGQIFPIRFQAGSGCRAPGRGSGCLRGAWLGACVIGNGRCRRQRGELSCGGAFAPCSWSRHRAS